LGAENRFEGLTVIDKNELMSRFKIPEDFIFYPAQTWKHKNHLGLLKAILQIREKFNNKVYLVCSGRKSSYYNELEIFIEDNNLQDQVSFLGFISIQELYSLYRYTALVVIPTIYEAGSFPLFEAMSIGSPVICSRTTSLPETIGDDRFTFDPNSIEEMELKISEMLNNKELKRMNIENSKFQIKRFSWKVVVKNFENAYMIAIENFNNREKH
jgi:glycosyltransferase involved in cell wall biosynthesis